jgi:hypothetical protein
MHKKLQEKLVTIYTRFKKLEKIEKLVCAAALLSVVGFFLPWYSDFDIYSNGVLYRGFEGPASFNSFAIVFANGLLILNFLSVKFKELFSKLELSLKKTLYYNVGFVGFNFVSYLATSLHHDVGVNPNYKSFGIGFDINILCLFYFCLLSFKYLKANPIEVSKYVMMDKDLKIEDVVQNNSPDFSLEYRKQQDLANKIQEKEQEFIAKLNTQDS